MLSGIKTGVGLLCQTLLLYCTSTREKNVVVLSSINLSMLTKVAMLSDTSVNSEEVKYYIISVQFMEQVMLILCHSGTVTMAVKKGSLR